MSNDHEKPDLAIIVPDLDIETVINTILSRPESLGIARITYRTFRHQERDPGVCFRGIEFSRELQLSQSYTHCLLIFDHHGSGRDRDTPTDIENDIEEELWRLGWRDQAGVIVISPELETWVWGVKPSHICRRIGWTPERLSQWLRAQGYLAPVRIKPPSPKEVFETLLREARIPRSSSIYRGISRRASLRSCSDRAFQKLCRLLQQWFS